MVVGGNNGYDTILPKCRGTIRSQNAPPYLASVCYIVATYTVYTSRHMVKSPKFM